ncbi:hypothetical protein LCGC14_1255730 [marine sediment metagenome]|uniref:Phage tail collar domain-containing protein n=1 Tax=marine sediment metagenome TaxID=412755 RepID=A0A0F9P5L5_9ZZZZ
MEIKTAHFKKGMILLWYGPVVLIPTGWQLCDGSNETPDLRNEFIVGAGDTYAVAATGGSLTHDHAFTTAGHLHALGYGAAISTGADYAENVDSAQDTGTTDAKSNLPPYYALAYIMKL